MDIQPQLIMKPFKSTVIALLFSLFLGPIGLLYATVIGSIVMTFLLLVTLSIKTNASGSLAVLIWMISIYWSVLATNRYNKKIWRYFGINFKKKPT